MEFHLLQLWFFVWIWCIYFTVISNDIVCLLCSLFSCFWISFVLSWDIYIDRLSGNCWNVGRFLLSSKMVAVDSTVTCNRL